MKPRLLHARCATSCALALPVLSIVLAASVHAQTYSTQVIAQNLNEPTGIAVAPNGDLWFTEVPEPGVMGGMNAVSRRDGASGTITKVSMGEPEPLNLAIAPNGDVYWTCRTAGVVIRRSGGSQAPWLRGLSSPSGISAPGGGTVWLTQVPTPGTGGSSGGMNTVDTVNTATMAITNVSMGEPEPVDVVAAPSGDAYWTCRTAGVIVGYDADTGQTSVVLGGLRSPTGIAMDADGNLYFTEVPNPGVGGAGNAVWKYDLDASALTLISMGEPEPNDVAVTPDGSTVYWTCTTAGVIVRATRTGGAPMVTSPSPKTVGSTVRLFLDAPGQGHRLYIAGSSTGLGPIPIDSRYVALEADLLLAETLGRISSCIATNYLGILDANGMGTAHLAIPDIAALAGLRVNTAFVVVDLSAPSGIAEISSTHTFVIE